MQRLFWTWVVSALALWLAAWVLPGVEIRQWVSVLWIAPLLGIINMVVGWVTGFISLLAFPVTILTLGCSSFILSFVLYAGAIYGLSLKLKDTFIVNSFWWALALAAVMALFSSVLNVIFPTKRG
jgi:putative membrane protein